MVESAQEEELALQQVLGWDCLPVEWQKVNMQLEVLVRPRTRQKATKAVHRFGGVVAVVLKLAKIHQPEAGTALLAVQLALAAD